MLFYDLIFDNHNEVPLRNLIADENDRFLKAYLMINSVVNNGFHISPEEIKSAIEADEIERVLVPNFIYQRDFISNLDFNNQLSRGIMFFEYLEKEPKLSLFTRGYYQQCGVAGFRELYYNLLTTFAQVEVGNAPNLRRNQIGFEGLEDIVNMEYIDHLSLNRSIPDYKAAPSFGNFRKHPLYKIADKGYLLLSMNFFLDQFFRAQVFAFKAYIEQNGFKGNFQSMKGKDFMEDIYFRKLMNDCFSTHKILDGDQAATKTGGELCDFYVRSGNNILLIEFKDILLNANVKANADEQEVYKELNIKFNRNQSNSPKGIMQLFNAVSYLEKQDLKEDELDRSTPLNIYPVVVYTDTAFGAEGINKIMNDKFKDMLAKNPVNDLVVQGVTFINLNYFEHHEEYLDRQIVDFFGLLSGYQAHILDAKFATSSFEVYSRVYFKENNMSDLPPGKKLAENMRKIAPELYSRTE